MNKDMKISFPGGKRVFSDYDGFSIETDQRKEDGGDSSAPTPSELFFASISTCTALYALRFCESRKIDTTQLSIKIEFQSNPKTHMVEKIRFIIALPPEFPEKYTSAMIKSMNLCYVKKHLQQPPQFEFEMIQTSGYVQ